MTTANMAGAHYGDIGSRLNRLPLTRTHRKIVVAVGVGLFFDMYEVYLSGTISKALTAEFGLSSALLPFFLGSAFIGMFFGALFLGRLADKIGRRNAFILNLAIYSLASLAGAFASDPWILVATRFVAGVGVGAEFPVGDSYLADFLPKKLRGKWSGRAYTYALIAVPVVGFLAMGMLPLAPLGFSGWRWLLAGGAVGAVIILFVRRGLPESPRWLASVGRGDEANAIVERMEREAGIDPKAALATPESLEDTHATVKMPVSALFRKPYRSRYFMWTGFHILEVIGYYGFGTLAPIVLVSRGYDITQSLLFTSLSYLGYPIGSAISVFLLDRFERKYLLMVTSGLMAAFGLAFGLSGDPALIVAFGFLFTITGQIFANTYHVYQAEIFPTPLRSTATGSTYSISRISAGAMPFVLLPLLNIGGAGLFFAAVATAMVIIVIIVGLLGPKTTGRPIEEISPIPAEYLPAGTAAETPASRTATRH